MKEKSSQMTGFSLNSIIDYCVVLNDPKIQLPFAIYSREIIEMFSEMKKLQPEIEMPTTTKSGRQVKKPARLIDEIYKMSTGEG